MNNAGACANHAQFLRTPARMKSSLLPTEIWLFSGVEVALVPALLWFIRRFLTDAPNHGSKNDARVTSIENASLLGSPIASGSNISQTVQTGISDLDL